MLSVDELRRAAADNPFPQADATPQLLHLFFLSQPPKTPKLDAMNELKTKSEQFALKGKVFYFYTPDGFGISKLATASTGCSAWKRRRVTGARSASSWS